MIEAKKKLEEDITAILKDYKLSIYQSPTSTKEAPIMYGLMRVPSSEWPNQKLSALLRSLPPSVRIVINPDRIV